MMGPPTWDDLLQMLVEARDGTYRDDPERDAARLATVGSVMQSMLEKLRDKAFSEGK